MNCQFKIIYSLRLHIKLRSLGFFEVMEMKNPQKPEYNCWVYEATEELLGAFDKLLKEDQKNGG